MDKETNTFKNEYRNQTIMTQGVYILAFVFTFNLCALENITHFSFMMNMIYFVPFFHDATFPIYIQHILNIVFRRWCSVVTILLNVFMHANPGRNSITALSRGRHYPFLALISTL